MPRTIASALVVASLLGGNGARAGHIHPAATESKPDSQNIRAYERVVGEWDANVTAFDHAHPFFGAVISDPTRMEHLIERWQLDEPRFEHWNPFLWKVLDGYLHLNSQIPSTLPPSNVSPPPAGSPATQISPPPDGEETTGAAPSLPEPSGLVLMLSGLVGLWISRLRYRV